MREPATGGRYALRVGIVFLTIFVVYQAAEALQTVFKRGGALGPALMLAALVIAWPLARLLGAKGYGAYGLEWKRGTAGLLAGGLLLAGLCKLAALALGLALGAYAPASTAPAGLAVGSVVLIAVSTLVPSLVEDILTRGLILRAPLRLNGWTYTLGSAALYTLNHIWRFGWGPSEQLRLICLGLAYGVAAWRWNSLWAAVALHWGWNLTSGLADLAVPLDTADAVAGRYVSAAVHLALMAILLLLARRARRSPG